MTKGVTLMTDDDSRAAGRSTDRGSIGSAEMLARSHKMVDGLTTRAAEAEHLRRLPDATMAEAVDADLFRMVVPTSLGGLGLGLDTLANSTRVLATGCPASAWTLSFLIMHNWLLTRFGAEFRDELFSRQPWALAPAPLNPTGTATPADGGYVVRGRWEWATGVEHADWVILHAVVARQDALETRFVVLPRGDVEVDDVWHTSGMRATGSNVIRVADTFVPAYRTVSAEQMMRPSSDPAAGDAMAPYPVVPVLALMAAAPAVGAAESCVELFRRRLSERVLAYTLGTKQADEPASRVRLATALAEVRAARSVWDDALAKLAGTAADGEPTVSDRMDARLAAASTVRLARQAISTVCEGSGASVYATTSPLQRLQRDVEVLKGHVIFDWDRCAELAGRIQLGLAVAPTDMV